MKNAIASDTCPAEYKEAFQEWIDGKDDADKSKAAAEKIIPMVEAAKDKCENCATIAEFKNYLVKKSQWIIGGDGASYDIGYGGLDHVIASGEDVNILVLDTEVYSNTGVSHLRLLRWVLSLSLPLRASVFVRKTLV